MVSEILLKKTLVENLVDYIETMKRYLISEINDYEQDIDNADPELMRGLMAEIKAIVSGNRNDLKKLQELINNEYKNIDYVHNQKNKTIDDVIGILQQIKN